MKKLHKRNLVQPSVKDAAVESLDALSREQLHELVEQLRSAKVQLETQNERLRSTQATLEQSHASYVDLYDQAPVGYCDIDVIGVITQVNLTLCALLNIPKSELVGRALSEFVVSEDQDRLSSLMRRFVGVPQQMTEPPQIVELRISVGAGESCWVKLVAAQLFNAVRAKFRVVISDVSERKRAESQLARSEARLRTIIETEPECVKLLDAEGCLLEMNAAGLRMIEADSFEQIKGHCVYSMVHIEHRDAFRALTARAFNGESGILEFKVTGLKGTSRWLETHVSPLSEGGGHITAALGITRDVTERKLAESSMRLSDLALKSISQGVLITDAKHLIVSANAAFCTITGYTEAEIIGRNCNFLQGRDTDPSTRLAIRTALANDTNFSGEILNYRKVGTWFWNELSISPVLNSEGIATHYIGVTRDVTARRLIEKANQENTMQLRLVIRGGDIGFWDWDVPSNGLAVNDRWLMMLGLDSHGPPPGIEFWHSLVHPEDVPKLDRLFNHVILNPDGVSGEAEIRARHREGHYIWILDRFSVVSRAEDGSPIRVVGTHLDISKRVEAESAQRQANSALRTSEELLRNIIDSTASHIFAFDLQHRFTLANQLMAKDFGQTPDQLIGKTLHEVLPFELAQEWLATNIQVIANGKAQTLEEYIPGNSVNEPRVMTTLKFPLRNAQGEIIGMGGVATDITERREMERLLRQTASTLEQRVIDRTKELHALQISKNRFFAAASHDLLQPLNAARIFVSSLAEQKELTDASLQIVQRVERALRGAEEVIDVLVDIAKLDTGAVRTTIEEVNLRELLLGLADQFSAIAERRSLQLRIGPCAVTVLTDRRLLRRVLQNLIANALRYTASGGLIIGVRRCAAGQLRVDVVDTGPGIPESAFAEIFEEFRSGGHSSPWGEKGLGLGLSICKRVCELLGHRLSLKSKLGRGSSFSVHIVNARFSAAANLRETPIVRRQFGLSRLKVLCVDDNIEVLEAMSTLLRSWEILYEVASDRSGALEAARRTRPDVVIIDYQFDDARSGDGLQILAAISALYPRHSPTAIMITANRSAELELITREREIPLLQKPLRAARLRSLLEAAARRFDGDTLQPADHLVSDFDIRPGEAFKI